MKKLLILFFLFIVGHLNVYGWCYAKANKNFTGKIKRIVLRGNEVGGKRIITQHMFQTGKDNYTDNTIFVIMFDFFLSDDITIPHNCVVEFSGGSISGHGLKGRIQNKVLYAKWFKDDASLLYSINNLIGYNVIHLETGKSYHFVDVLSPQYAITINGHFSKIGREGITNASKPIIRIDTEEKLEYINLENINFDGSIASGLPVEVDYHQNMVVINNVSNVHLKNVRFENFRPPYISNVSPSNDFINISQYNYVRFDNVVFKNNLMYGEVVNLFPAGGNATPATNLANDLVEISNSVFDFRGGRCYSVINCHGGRLIFTHNEIYGCIGALNAFVHDSYITNNIYADAENGFVDLSEQGLFYSKNVHIANNTIKNITKFNHAKYGQNNTHLLECYGAENITVTNNVYEPASSGNESDGMGHVFALSNGTKNVLIKNNRILCNGQLYGNVLGAPNENIHFIENDIYQGHHNIYGLIRLRNEKDISFDGNTFQISNSNTEKISGALVFIDKLGQPLKGFKFSKNKIHYSVPTSLFIYVGQGDYPAMFDVELIRNKAYGRGKMPIIIKNRGGGPIKMRNNKGMNVFEK